MKAWLVNQWGEPEDMILGETADRMPARGEVRIRNHAAAVNFFDVLQIQGKYQVKPPFPFTPGAEVAGVIDAVGEGVTEFTPGQRVTAMSQGGGFAEAAVCPANRVFSIPDSMNWEAAAALPIVYQTSWFALDHRGKLREGEWMLVHAGSSGVGMSAIQIGKAMGAKIIATASTPEKRAFCLAQGADHAIDYAEPSWVDQVKQLTGGRGADVIYDPVGGDAFDLSSKCIASEGRHLVIGFASGRIPSMTANRALLKNMSLVGVFWGGYTGTHPAYIAETHGVLMRMFAEGKINPVVTKSWPFAETPAALRSLANRQAIGKVVLRIGG